MVILTPMEGDNLSLCIPIPVLQCTSKMIIEKQINISRSETYQIYIPGTHQRNEWCHFGP